jgi:translation initiation factor 4B
VRPRLNLAKRTVSEAEPATAPSSSDSKASPFGAARPIDTAAREREVAEKRELALRQKREAEEKAREEKKAREAATKEEAEDGEDGQENSKASGEKENGDAPRPSYQILSRSNGEVEEAEEESQDASANGDITEDKAAKPREFVREPPKGPKADRRGGGGAEWRRKSSTPNTPVSPKPNNTSETPEEDGWSTVPTKQRGRGRGGARAVAS